MPSRQVEIVERVYELYNRLDPDPDVRNASPEAAELMALYDPEIVYVQTDLQVDAVTSHGIREYGRVWNDWLTLWKEHRSELVEVQQEGDRVMALSKDHYVGRDGIEINRDGAMIFTFRGGTIVRVEAMLEHELARRKLREET